MGGLLTAGLTMLNRVQSGLPDTARGNGQVPSLTETAPAGASEGGGDPAAGAAPSSRRSARPNREA